MTQYLPPNLLALFAPRDPIPYLAPVDKLTWEKKTDGYSGVAQLIQRFEVWLQRLCIIVYIFLCYGIVILLQVDYINGRSADIFMLLRPKILKRNLSLGS